VEPWFGFVETTLDHCKRNEHFIVDELLDRCRHLSLEVPLKKHEALPGVSPLLSRRPDRSEWFPWRSPVGKSGGVREDVTHRDVAAHVFIDVLDECESDVSDHLFDERGSIHYSQVTANLVEFPRPNGRDRRLPHAVELTFPWPATAAVPRYAPADTRDFVTQDLGCERSLKADIHDH
jgi:hypothetical protein